MFLTNFRDTIPMSLYEVLTPGNPVRMYFDIEHPDCSVAPEIHAQFQEHWVNFARARSWGESVSVWSSHSPSKASFHVLLPDTGKPWSNAIPQYLSIVRGPVS